MHTDYPLIADLVFYARTSDPLQRKHHVGIIVGKDIMIDSPDVGKFIRTEAFWRNMETLFFGYLVDDTCGQP